MANYRTHTPALRARHVEPGPAPAEEAAAPAVQPGVRPTSRFEQALIAALVILLPLDNMLPVLGPVSTLWILFAGTFLFVFLFRRREMIRVLSSTTVLSLALLLSVALATEFRHPDSSMSDWIRLVQMAVASVLVATMCRDRLSLRAALISFLVIGVFLSAILFTASYQGLLSASASDFDQASKVRESVYQSTPLGANLNRLAFQTAQATIVAIALLFAVKRPAHRIALGLLAATAAIATFLPLSRGGVITLVIGAAVVLMSARKPLLSRIAVVAILAGAVIYMVPDAAWARLNFRPHEYSNQRKEARTGVYTAALDTLPEYILTGIGSGNFWEQWGQNNGFSHGNGKTLGAHNSILQITINWGIAGLLPFTLVLWNLYRVIPRGRKLDHMQGAIRGLATTGFCFLLVSHTYYAKELSIIVGVVLGAHLWIFRPLPKTAETDARQPLPAYPYYRTPQRRRIEAESPAERMKV
jgi:O-antigen ligase